MLHIPKFADLSASNYTENNAVSFSDPSNGEWTLAITAYKQCGVAITDKLKQDSFYMSQIQSKFPEMAVRALMEDLETAIMNIYKNATDGQTASNANLINGQPHQYVGTGTGEIISLNDVIQAKLSLDKANVSKIGRVAVVDPTVSATLMKIDNVIRQDELLLAA